MNQLNYTNFTVYNASAGAGKTYQITQDLIHYITGEKTGHPIAPSEIIATTFTEKAAAELKRRIRESLLDKSLLEEAQELPSALIGTVNSVTSHIVQTFAIDNGSDPDLQILDENSQVEAFRIATEEALYTLEAENRPLLNSLGYTPEASGFSDGTWESAVRRICELARTNDINPSHLPSFAETSKQSLLQVLEETGPSFDTYLAPLHQALQNFLNTQEAEAQKTTKATDKKKIESALTWGKHALNTLEQALDAYKKNSSPSWATIANFTKEYISDGNLLMKIFSRGSRSALLKDHFENLALGNYKISTDPLLRQCLTKAIDLTFQAAADCLTAYTNYKTSLGLIDFTDQEHKALHLLRNNTNVQAAIRDQYRILVVDEFQDTSPLQLAVFIELAKLVEKVIWVGDPKQSIYRFRGADPQLMGSALRTIRTTNQDSIKTLTDSWRTHPLPLQFSNSIFSRALVPHTVPTPEDVILNIHEDRLKELAGEEGNVHIWQTQDQEADIFRLLATGIAQEIQDTNPTTPQPSRAVLVRSNDDVQKVITSLTDLGIPVAGDHYRIKSSRELQALAAAIAFAQDRYDAKALIQLVQLLPQHPAHQGWLTHLSSLTSREERRAQLHTWAQDPTLQGLHALSSYTGALNPADFVRRTIDAIDLPGLISTWTQPQTRYAALDGAVQLAHTYQEESQAAGATPTLQGYLDYLAGNNTSRFPQQEGAVYVHTMHGAKGLEWDHVYLAVNAHQPGSKFIPGGSWVQKVANENFSIEKPLQGRTLYFWPVPLKKHQGNYQGPLADLGPLLEEHELQVERKNAEIEEEQRLYYVALTRSKKLTVLVIPENVEDHLPELSYLEPAHKKPENKLSFYIKYSDDYQKTLDDYNARVQPAEGSEEGKAPAPVAPAEQEGYFQILMGHTPEIVASVPITIKHLPSATEALAPTTGRTPTAALESSREASFIEADLLPARITASLATASQQMQDAARITRIATLGKPLVDQGGQNWELVGDAIHSFLALPLEGLDPTEQEGIAQGVIDRWGGPALQVGIHELVTAARLWKTWVAQQFPAADGWQELTEVPFTWVNEAGQTASGWMDSVLMREAADGPEVVLVDHKSYPGDEPEKKLRQSYVGQMGVYAQVLQDLLGCPPQKILMHLPLRGEVWEMQL